MVGDDMQRADVEHSTCRLGTLSSHNDVLAEKVALG